MWFRFSLRHPTKCGPSNTRSKVPLRISAVYVSQLSGLKYTKRLPVTLVRNAAIGAYISSPCAAASRGGAVNT